MNKETVSITSLSHEGRGIAKLDQKTLFIEGALPEETVSFHYTKRHKNFDEAKVENILVPSLDRQTPFCPHFDRCGGCTFQHASPTLQLAHKQSVLLEQLWHMGKVRPEEVLPPLTGPLQGYRKKARLGVRYVSKKGRVLVGFRERQSAFLAELNECPVLDPRVGQLILPLRDLISSLTVYDKIAQIEVAVDDQRAALVFRNLAPLSAQDEANCREFAKTHQLWLYLQPGNPQTVYRLYPDETVEPLLSYKLPEFQLEFAFHPMDFTQINSEINSKLVSQALKWLDPTSNDTILDLFCGLGNFTLPIARFAKQVVGVEGSELMVERAQKNAQLNQLQNVEFYAENLQAETLTGAWCHRSYDKILLDPPRTGAKECIKLMGKFCPERIVYVSCNPATLARDAGLLVHEEGYRLIAAGIIDMFPHTQHVESMAVFER